MNLATSEDGSLDTNLVDSSVRENAEMLVSMLESVYAIGIPTVEELVADFYQRY